VDGQLREGAEEGGKGWEVRMDGREGGGKSRLHDHF